MNLFWSLLDISYKNGHEDERKEIVARLLAAGMSVEEISVILCIYADKVKLIENNMSTILPKYRKTLKEHKQRKEKLVVWHMT